MLMLCRPSEGSGGPLPRHRDWAAHEEDVSGRLPIYRQDRRLEGPAKREFIASVVLNILAFGRDQTFDDLDHRPPTPEKTSELGDDALNPTVMTHNFPVYVEGMSEWSNGVSLIHREP